MLNSLRISVNNVQLQQLRHGHRVRGVPPLYARSLKQRLDELNFKEEIYTEKTNIGLPHYKKSLKETHARHMEHIKKIKADKDLEQLARYHKLRVNPDEVRQEWLKGNGPFQKKQIATHYGIYEHLYGEGYFIPFVNLDIVYEVNNEEVLPVYYGNCLKPKETQRLPKVSYESEGNELWTLALTGLDSHLTESDKEYVHWLVANIPSDQIEKGDTVVEYLQPFPPKGTGYHRYVFVLYKQIKRIDYDIKKVTSASPLESRTFVTRDWYQRYQDNITPSGLAFFQADWDETLKDFYHHTLKMKEPIYEYDFPEPYIKPQVWFPIRQPFNLYMDKYRDPKQINKEYLIRKLQNEDPFKKPDPPLRYPNAHVLPKNMPSWLRLHEKKIRLSWGRVNDV